MVGLLFLLIILLDRQIVAANFKALFGLWIVEGFSRGNVKLREKSRKIRFTNPVPFLSLCKFLHKPEFQVPNTTIKNFPSHFFMHILSNAGV